MTQQRLLIIGARQHTKVLVSIAEEFYSDQVEIVGFLDDDPRLQDTCLLGYPVLGPVNALETLAGEQKATAALVGISNRYMALRQELFRKIRALDLQTPALIHGRAYVSPQAQVGPGSALNPGVVVNCFARVGANCVIYSNATIEHETVLEDNVYIGPGVNFSSNAKVGSGTFIGAGSRIIPDIRIGANVVIGAGSVVIEDLPDNTTYAGIPARKINDRNQTVI